MATDSKAKGPVMGPLECTIGGEVVTAYPKVFKTGTHGWHMQKRMLVQGIEAQVNLLIYLPGTVAPKEGEQKGTAPATAPSAPKTRPGGQKAK